MAMPNIDHTKLKTYGSAAAGHEGVLADPSSGLVLKPSTKTELAFYESLISTLPNLAPFVPEFLGKFEKTIDASAAAVTVAVPDVAPATSEEAPGLEPDNLRAKGKHIDSNVFVVLADAAAGMKRPNVLDIKLGAQLYDDSANDDKKQRMITASKNSTSGSLGARIAGMRIWEQNEPSGTFLPLSQKNRSYKCSHLADEAIEFDSSGKIVATHWENYKKSTGARSSIGSKPRDGGASSETPTVKMRDLEYRLQLDAVRKFTELFPENERGPLEEKAMRYFHTQREKPVEAEDEDGNVIITEQAEKPKVEAGAVDANDTIKLQRFHSNNNNDKGVDWPAFCVYNKLYGRGLTDSSFSLAIERFFHSISEWDNDLRCKVARAFTAETARLLDVLENTDGLRTIASSVLMVYEGDVEELRRKLARASGVITGANAEGGIETAHPVWCRTKFIDFAHATVVPGRGKDENTLQGLRKTVACMREICANLVKQQDTIK